jgi:hypothetical protein
MKKTVGLRTIPLTMLYPYVSCNMVMNCIFTVLDMSFNASTFYYCYYIRTFGNWTFCNWTFCNWTSSNWTFCGCTHETEEGGVFLCLIVMTQICFATFGVYFYLLSAEEKTRKKLSFSDLCCNRFCETKE